MKKKADGFTGVDHGIDSILMIGQSNMAGRGDFGEVAPIKNDLCYMLRMGMWQEMAEPINPDCDVFESFFHSGISLAASFADEYAKHYQRKIGLIPAAFGGSSIDQWQVGGVLFEHAVMCVKLAKMSSNFKGIIWHQGETDCSSDRQLENYPEKFYRFFDALIEETGAENLPIVIGELSEHVTENWLMSSRNILFNERLPQLISRYPNMTFVSAKGLTLKNDGIHFDSQSSREFGLRYFEAFKTLRAAH